MGEMSDIFDHFYNNDYRFIESDLLEQYNNKELYWNTEDDVEILIQNLSTAHILNIIKMVENQSASETKNGWLTILNLELENRDKYS